MKRKARKTAKRTTRRTVRKRVRAKKGVKKQMWFKISPADKKKLNSKLNNLYKSIAQATKAYKETLIVLNKL